MISDKVYRKSTSTEREIHRHLRIQPSMYVQVSSIFIYSSNS
jgi:hypothetical protein